MSITPSLVTPADLDGGRVVVEETRQVLEAAVIRCEANQLSVVVTSGVAQFDLQLDIDANIKQADKEALGNWNIDQEAAANKKCLGRTSGRGNNCMGCKGLKVVEQGLFNRVTFNMRRKAGCQVDKTYLDGEGIVVVK
jgi:hypothetical protein